jgi:hypothetical protein
MCSPTVYARADTASADSAAGLPVSTRTRLKSVSKRAFIAVRVSASSGWPGSASTSRTTGGATCDRLGVFWWLGTADPFLIRT